MKYLLWPLLVFPKTLRASIAYQNATFLCNKLSWPRQNSHGFGWFNSNKIIRYKMTNQQKCQKWLKMAESQSKGLKTPVNGLLLKDYGFGPLFGYHNFQNQIDTWETTVLCRFVYTVINKLGLCSKCLYVLSNCLS